MITCLTPIPHASNFTQPQELEAPPQQALATSPKKSFINYHTIKTVAQVIFKAAVTIALYWAAPTFCAVGFISGIVFDSQIADVINKIMNILNTQTWGATALAIFAFVLSSPVAFAASSFFWAANLGSSISTEVERLLREKQLFPSANAC